MNKSLTLLFTLFIVTTVGYGQTSSGNMMAGGTIDLNSVSRQTGTNFSDFTFVPSFGYFISDDLAIGASLTIGGSRSGSGASKSTSSSFGIGPFARYYMYSSNESLAFFGQATLAFGTAKSNSASGVTSHTTSITFALSPGAAYFFNEHWAAEVSITGLSINSYDPDTNNKDDKSTTVHFALSSIAPTLGFRYHF